VTDFETLEIEDRGAVRIIRINRPKVLNALNATVVGELSKAFEAVGKDPSVRGVVLTGAGDKAFIAGADIAAMSDMDEQRALVFASQGHGVGEMIANLGVPVIAAVGGFALGGGCEMALACDFIYASDRARFGQPEVKLGVIPGFGGTQRLLRRIGKARALELCLTGEMIGAEEALRLGLINRIVPHEAVEETVEIDGKSQAKTRRITTEPVVAAAVATLEAVAAMGPLAIAQAKQVMHRGAELPLEAANQLEVEAFAALFETEDQSEGMKAFLEKRDAQFTGK
jgi:enoyl-CoA hydratase